FLIPHTPLPLRTTLFPYTTLFRSAAPRDGADAMRFSFLCAWRAAYLSAPLAGMRSEDVQSGERPDPAYNAPPVHVHRSGLLPNRSEEHTSELQSRGHLVCRLLLEK